MYEVAHISNLLNEEVKVIISLKELERILEELQQLRKYKREKEK